MYRVEDLNAGDSALGRLVDEAAYRTYRRYKEYVDLDDLKQEIRAWLTSHASKLEQLCIDKESGPALDNALTLRFTGVADKYSRREKAHRVGYEPSDEYFYSTETIARLLPLALDLDAELAPAAPESSESKPTSLPSEGGKLTVLVADVRSALKTLHDDKYEIVAAYYGEGKTDGEIAVDRGVTIDHVRGKRGAALRVLRRQLGGRKPYAA